MTADRSDLLPEDPADVVEAAREAGVARMICVGIDPDSSRRSLELAESFRGVFASAGVHPHTASDFDRRAGSVIEELLADPLVVAVGETGLDHHRRLSPPEDQERAFRTHIALSRETGKPLVVHVREAWPEALRILEEEGAERVVLHCFSGDASVATEANRRGYVASFAGNITYPNAGSLREAAAEISDGRFILETDSPFLPPQRLRGTTNSPSNVLDVAETMAEVRGVKPNDIISASSSTASRVFDLPN